MLGHWEIIAIILLALLIFGPKKIPELMRGLGRGMREFKDSMRGMERDENREESTKKPEKETMDNKDDHSGATS